MNNVRKLYWNIGQWIDVTKHFCYTYCYSQYPAKYASARCWGLGREAFRRACIKGFSYAISFNLLEQHTKKINGNQLIQWIHHGHMAFRGHSLTAAVGTIESRVRCAYFILILCICRNTICSVICVRIAMQPTGIGQSFPNDRITILNFSCFHQYFGLSYANVIIIIIFFFVLHFLSGFPCNRLPKPSPYILYTLFIFFIISYHIIYILYMQIDSFALPFIPNETYSFHSIIIWSPKIMTIPKFNTFYIRFRCEAILWLRIWNGNFQALILSLSSPPLSILSVLSLWLIAVASSLAGLTHYFESWRKIAVKREKARKKRSGKWKSAGMYKTFNWNALNCAFLCICTYIELLFISEL